jgi:surface antigen
MTNLPNDVTSTKPATRRQLTRVLAVGALAAGAAVGIAVPAQAASNTAYHIAGASGAGSRVVNDPRGAHGTTIGRLANGTSVTIDCGVAVRDGRHNNAALWHHITAPVTGYISDYYLDTPNLNRLLPGEATCGTSTVPSVPATKPTTAPTTPATKPTTSAPTKPAPTTSAPTTSVPAAKRGATINYNEGYAGSCVYYVMDRFHKVTGVYPKAFGDAKFLASSAASNGWTVSDLPRVDSLAVFQPGQNGAGAPTGHVAWVEQISGNRIYVAEMNAPNPYEISYRWLTPVAGVRYIYVV